MEGPQAPLYYVRQRGHIKGPIDAATLIAQARAAGLSSLDEFSTDRTTWRRFHSLEELESLTRKPQTTPQPAHQATSDQTQLARQQTTPQGSPHTGHAGPVVNMIDDTTSTSPLSLDRTQQFDPDHSPFGPPLGGTRTLRNPLAAWGFTCSLAGLVLMGTTCPLGVVLSARALNRPRGRFLALTGIILGIIGTVGWLVGMIYYWFTQR